MKITIPQWIVNIINGKKKEAIKKYITSKAQSAPSKKFITDVKNKIKEMKDSAASSDGNTIQSFILSIVGVGVVLAVGMIVLSQIKDSMSSSGDSAYNTTSPISEMSSALPNLASWIGIIVTVSLAFVILGFFYNRI